MANPEEEEDELYAQLYGETLEKPAEEEKKGIEEEQPQQYVSQAVIVSNNDLVQQAQAGAEGAEAEDGEDDDIDIILNNQEENDEDDDLDIVLNDSSAKPQSAAGNAGGLPALNNQFTWTRPGTSAGDPASLVQKPIGGLAPKPILSAAAAVHAHPHQRPIWMPYVPPPEYDQAALPSKAKPGQGIRLPGQTKVSPEEYREFLSLGHGELFDIDLDRVIESPWRARDAKTSDYFNYNLDEGTWREYCKQVKQYRLGFTMQSDIDTVQHTVQHIDSDLPPELAAAFQNQPSRYTPEENAGVQRAGAGAIPALSSQQLELIKRQKMGTRGRGRGRGRGGGRPYDRYQSSMDYGSRGMFDADRGEGFPPEDTRGPTYAQVLTGGDSGSPRQSADHRSMPGHLSHNEAYRNNRDSRDDGHSKRARYTAHDYPAPRRDQHYSPRGRGRPYRR